MAGTAAATSAAGSRAGTWSSRAATKDMIERGGEKISAEEVENLVYRLPAVSQVAAVAMPDPELGERVCVFVVPRPGGSVTLDDVRAAMDGVARFERPERPERVDELPVTNAGKIDERVLRGGLGEP